ncbi:hypothetical protein TNCV_3634851 [Trichonephila clavipes]|nr:hypothetical protein TNCV_3634851 [Trichonephila clavipes]
MKSTHISKHRYFSVSYTFHHNSFHPQLSVDRDLKVVGKDRSGRGGSRLNELSVVADIIAAGSHVFSLQLNSEVSLSRELHLMTGLRCTQIPPHSSPASDSPIGKRTIPYYLWRVGEQSSHVECDGLWVASSCKTAWLHLWWIHGTTTAAVLLAWPGSPMKEDSNWAPSDSKTSNLVTMPKRRS